MSKGIVCGVNMGGTGQWMAAEPPKGGMVSRSGSYFSQYYPIAMSKDAVKAQGPALGPYSP